MKRLSLALAATLAALSCAHAQTHVDKSGTIVPGVAPIYLYVSAGAARFGVSITTIGGGASFTGGTVRVSVRMEVGTPATS
jgi:hypothetical protein